MRPAAEWFEPFNDPQVVHELVEANMPYRAINKLPTCIRRELTFSQNIVSCSSPTVPFDDESDCFATPSDNKPEPSFIIQHWLSMDEATATHRSEVAPKTSSTQTN